MVQVVWKEAPTTWTACVDNAPVCSLKVKDIGGCMASWQNGNLWTPPAHMPKAAPQTTCFFPDLDEAKRAVEQQLQT